MIRISRFLMLILVPVSLLLSTRVRAHDEPPTKIKMPMTSMSQYGAGVVDPDANNLIALHCLKTTGVILLQCVEFRFRHLRIDGNQKLWRRWLGAKSFTSNDFQAESKDPFRMRPIVSKKHLALAIKGLTSDKSSAQPTSIPKKDFISLLQHLERGEYLKKQIEQGP